MAKRKAGIVKRQKGTHKNTVYVYPEATAEELEEVKKLIAIGWTSKIGKRKEEVEVEPHEITKEFNIGYDEVRKEDMVKYIKGFVEDKEALKNFAIAAHKTVKGKENLDKNGKPKYNHIAAKQYFYKTFFPKKWEDIEKMLDERKFKTKAKKEAADIDKELKSFL